jgi:hypothetical protein
MIHYFVHYVATFILYFKQCNNLIADIWVKDGHYIECLKRWKIILSLFSVTFFFHFFQLIPFKKCVFFRPYSKSLRPFF